MSTITVPGHMAFGAAMHAQVWLEERWWRRATPRYWRTHRLIRVTERACALNIDVTLDQQDVRDIGWWLRGNL